MFEGALGPLLSRPFLTRSVATHEGVFVVVVDGPQMIDTKHT